MPLQARHYIHQVLLRQAAWRQRKALKAANTALAELKELLDGSRLVNGKLSKAVISKAKKLLAGA